MPPLTISVIMPAYNCAKYLREAIDSVLQQTFADFEFIIVNDGSSDNTEDVINMYTDSRIVYLKNPVNKGLVYTLNYALSKANGIYTARMDGDDISLPERLQKQLDHLVRNPGIDVLATQVSLINEHGNDVGIWNEDIEHSNASSIRHYLPFNNCIAHPTVMGRTEVFLKYKYLQAQRLSEDYDLWLRIIADGGIIDKLPQPLLMHRILASSFTRTQKINVYYKLSKVKWTFFKSQLKKGRINKVVLMTFMAGIADILKGTGKNIKRLTRN